MRVIKWGIFMKQYLDLMKDILENGVYRPDRTGTGTLSVFGRQLRFDLSNKNLPVITTKKVHLKSVIHELLWMIRGDTNIRYLNDRGVTIWDEWADERGNLGPIYGKQWRAWHISSPLVPWEHFMTFDQLTDVINSLKQNPYSRRHIVSAWNAGEVDIMALPPCHVIFQFFVAPGAGNEKEKLSCHMYQRSADVFLGLPFNITSYALLTHMVAAVTNFSPKELIITLGDAHIYSNHEEQCRLQLTREPLIPPKVELNTDVMDIDNFEFDDITIKDYIAHPSISGKIAV